MPFTLRDKTVLEVCCGSGIGTEYYVRQGARVIASDMSFEALRRARQRCQKYNFEAEFMVADCENLPLLYQAIDVATVHDGLHHLDIPHYGISEMARVARSHNKWTRRRSSR